METRVVIDKLEFDLSHRDKMTFKKANELCVDGWRIPKIEELAILGEKYYAKGNKVFLGGRHFSPRLYWTPGMVMSHRGGEIISTSIASCLFYFDLNCGWYIGNHLDKYNLILIKDL
jgi:hypothetical protein